MNTLLQLVDETLDRWIAQKGNFIPGPVPDDMAGGPGSGGWNSWLPIGSRVTDEQLARLAAEIGVSFPRQYQQILKHKHFIDLHIGSVSFIAHPSVGWQDCLKKDILDGWPREYLLDKGFVPFAMYSDWGEWCFSVRERSVDGEDPIYLWDHDSPNEHEYVAATLEEALRKELEADRAFREKHGKSQR